MSALSFSSQPIPQAKAYAYGSVYKGAPNWRDELLPGAVVKGPANFTSAPALGSVVKGGYTDENGTPIHLGRIAPLPPSTCTPQTQQKLASSIPKPPPITFTITSTNHSFARRLH